MLRFPDPLNRAACGLLLACAVTARAAEPATQAPAPALAAPPAAGTEPASAVPAGSTTREQALSTLLEATGNPELVWLTAEGKRFFALYRVADKPKGALLIVPGPGQYADAAPLAHALRVTPTGGGWSTLAVQLPLPDLAAAAPAPRMFASQVCARINAGLAHLRETGATAIGVAAVDASAAQALDCLAATPAPAVLGVAALGRWRSARDDLPLAVLDLVPALDPTAGRLADARAARHAAAAGVAYRRDDLPAVDTRFTGVEEDVAKRVRGWFEHAVANAAARLVEAPRSAAP